MNHGRLALPVILALALASTHAIAVDRARLNRLVAESRVDLTVLGAIRNAIGKNLTDDEPALVACYQDMPDDAFRQPVVDYLATKLTDADIEQGLAFYATPLGRKIAANNRGDQPKPPPVGLTREEFAAKEAFVNTPAGHELVGSDGLVHSEQVEKAFITLYLGRRPTCGTPRMDR